MTDKSYVGTGYYICPICGTKHSESLLIDKRMRDTLTQDMYLGQEICPEDKKKFDEGYIAFVECENSDSTRSELKQEEAVRTGKIIHVRKEAISRMFNYPEVETPFVFCTKEVGDMLTNLVTEITDPEPTSTLH